MNIRKVYKIVNEEQYNMCVSYLIGLNMKQSGGYMSYEQIQNCGFKRFDNTIYIIVIPDNEFYFRRSNELDNTECPYHGAKTIRVEYELINFNKVIRKNKLKKLDIRNKWNTEKL